MSKKFFRPPPEAFEDESEDESEEEEPPQQGRSSGAANNTKPSVTSHSATNANLSSDEEDSGEEDSEEEEETNKKRKKSGAHASPPKKKSKAASFFDMEAEASDDEDDDDYGNKDGEQMDEETREIIRQQDRRRAASGRFGERSVAEISREIENRHRLQSRRVDRSVLLDRAVPESRAVARPQGGGAAAISIGATSAATPIEDMEEEVGYTQAVAQQSLMPSVSDPSLWMVSCLTGKEQELVFQIMNKCTALARQGRPLGISAAVAAQSKGKIYIESYNEPSVLEAIQGVRGLMQYTMRLVPIGDMTTVSKHGSVTDFVV
jgi:transcription elongation factor SPT5